MNENAYVVYYIDGNGYQYCISSGEMKFTTNINHAHQYKKEEAISIANYFCRSNRCAGYEVGYITIIRTVGDKHISRHGGV